MVPEDKTAYRVARGASVAVVLAGGTERWEYGSVILSSYLASGDSEKAFGDSTALTSAMLRSQGRPGGSPRH